MRTEPIIPKLRTGGWSFHTAVDYEGNRNGSIVADVESGRPYCIAKQPKLMSKEEWETHARAITAIPTMTRILVEEWYELGETMMELTKKIEMNPRHKYPYQERLDKLRIKYDKVEQALIEVGAFHEDTW